MDLYSNEVPTSRPKNRSIESVRAAVSRFNIRSSFVQMQTNDRTKFRRIQIYTVVQLHYALTSVARHTWSYGFWHRMQGRFSFAPSPKGPKGDACTLARRAFDEPCCLAVCGLNLNLATLYTFFRSNAEAQ